MKNKSKIFKLVACILLIMGIIFFVLGFQKKNNYNNGEYGDAKNAYVGGDAYNYIINANYFTGYMIIGSTAFLGSVLIYVTSIFIDVVKNEEDLPQL